jgi:hypothetical protein
MREARRRLAIVASLAAGAASAAAAAGIVSCQAIVGIKDRELASADVGNGTDADKVSAEVGTGDEANGDATPGTSDDGMTGVGDVKGGGDSNEVQEAGGGHDGGSGETDGGPSDAPVGDGGGMVDAGLPMDPDVPCSQQPSFLYCNDFDSVTSAAQTWDFAYLSNPDSGALLQIDSTNYVSPPHSVQVVAPTVNGISEVQLGKDVGILSSNCRLAFDVRVDVSTLTGIPQVGLAQMYIERATNPLQVNYVVGPGSSSTVQVYGSTDAAGPINLSLAVPTPMAWARVVLSYDSVNGITVFRNGQQVGSLAVGPGAPGDTKIIMGNSFINTGGTETVTTEEDNIVLSGR